MSKTTLQGALTIRIDREAVRRLRRRASDAGLTVSELARRLLEASLGRPDESRTALERSARWVGAVRSRAVPAGRDARAALEDWGPDRRG